MRPCSVPGSSQGASGYPPSFPRALGRPVGTGRSHWRQSGISECTRIGSAAGCF